MYPIASTVCFVKFALYKCEWTKWRTLQESLRAEEMKQTGKTHKGKCLFNTGKSMYFSETAQKRASHIVVLESQLILRTFTFLIHQFLFSALSPYF